MEITIKRDGKLYSVPTYTVDRKLTLVMIKMEDLEEVKENKEPETPQFTPGQEERDEEGFTEEAGDRLLRSTYDPENGITGVFTNSKDLIESLHKLAWSPTPGQEIEVSGDKDDWFKRLFVKMDDGEFICEHDYEEGETCSWKFARPLEQVTIPEIPTFNWDWVMTQLEQSQKLNEIPFTALALMATHMGAMDKLLHSQFPNSKPK